MSLNFVTKLAPFLAGFVAWMLSGSPIPMVFSVFLLGSSMACSRWTRNDSARRFLRLLFPFLAMAAAVSQLWLFRMGLAMALSAELPLSFHLGIAILWSVAMEAAMIRSDQRTGIGPFLPLLGITGCLILFSSALATELYDFGPWQVYPLAALSAALFAFAAISQTTNAWKIALPSLACSLVLTVFAIYLERGTDYVFDLVYRDDSSLDHLSSTPAPRFDSGSGAMDGSSRRLPRKANIRFDDRIRLFLKTDSPDLFRSWMKEPLYLRTSTVAVFESDEVIAPIRSGRWIYDSDDGESDNRIPLHLTPPSLVHDYTLFIERDGANALPLLVGSSQVNATALYEFADGWYQLAPSDAIKRLRYTSSIENPTPNFLTKLPEGDLRRPDGPGVYLNLPPSPLAARVSRLCDSLETENPVETIRHHLQSRSSYSLAYETPDNMSPVESLLFGERRGHCELYAAASVMMLRSMDIPCRLAYGFTGGMADHKQRVIAFRDRDFHAWAEILGPDNRWIVFDATPTTENATRRIPARTTFAAADWASYENFSSGGSDLAENSFSLLPGLIGITAFLSQNFLALTALGMVSLGFGWWWRASRGKQAGQPILSADSHRDQEVALPLLREIESCGRHFGMVRDSGQTWKEFLTQLRQEAPLPDCFTFAVDYYYRVRYAKQDPEPARETTMQETLVLWRKSLATQNGIED